MNKEKIYKEIIKEALDLHLHIGPELLPRKYTLKTLIKSERGKLGGVCLKSHFFPTTPFIKELEVLPKNFRLVGSVTLNNSVGGLNPEAVRAAAALSEKPIIVWFPTISARNFLDKSEYEIRPEWVAGTSYKPRRSEEVKGIEIHKGGILKPEAQDVLKAIKETGSVVATGHISYSEARLLVIKAREMGIKAIVTHPIYPLINMPLAVQKELAKRGAFIEVPYSMFSIDRISIQRIADQIKAIGTEFCFLSSDVGQIKSPSPSQALLAFLKLLAREGLNENDFYLMLVKNPSKLIS